MPRLNDHGLGGGGKSLGVPVYPFDTKRMLVEDYKNGQWVYKYGDNTSTAPYYISRIGCTSKDDEIYCFFNGTVNYKYNVKSRIWTQLANSDVVSKIWAVTYGNLIYYGTWTNKESYSKIYKYDILNNTHSLVSTLEGYKMEYTRACLDGDFIYMFGATSDNYKLAYKFDLINETWTQLTDLPNDKYYHSLINGDNGYIYIFGGGSSSEYKVAYKYDILNDSYTRLPDTLARRYGSLICKIDDYIFLINFGGEKTMECFNIKTETYTGLSATPTDRSHGHAVVIDYIIYMMGGNDSDIYKDGESLLYMMGNYRDVFKYNLNRGVKLYTDGDVATGDIMEFSGITTLRDVEKIEKTNDTVRVPVDNEYKILDPNYVTIAG